MRTIFYGVILSFSILLLISPTIQVLKPYTVSTNNNPDFSVLPITATSIIFSFVDLIYKIPLLQSCPRYYKNYAQLVHITIQQIILPTDLLQNPSSPTKISYKVLSRYLLSIRTSLNQAISYSRLLFLSSFDDSNLPPRPNFWSPTNLFWSTKQEFIKFINSKYPKHTQNFSHGSNFISVDLATYNGEWVVEMMFVEPKIRPIPAVPPLINQYLVTKCFLILTQDVSKKFYSSEKFPWFEMPLRYLLRSFTIPGYTGSDHLGNPLSHTNLINSIKRRYSQIFYSVNPVIIAQSGLTPWDHVVLDDCLVTQNRVLPSNHPSLPKELHFWIYFSRLPIELKKEILAQLNFNKTDYFSKLTLRRNTPEYPVCDIPIDRTVTTKYFNWIL